MSDRAETVECLRVLRECRDYLADRVDISEQNENYPNEAGRLLNEVDEALRLFDVANHPIMQAHDKFVEALKS